MKAGITLSAHLTTEVGRKNAMKNKKDLPLSRALRSKGQICK